MPKLLYTHSYIKKAAKFVQKHPELLTQYEKTLRLLENNPFHPSLRLHKLEGRLSELYSVSINLSYGITIDFIIEKDAIIPIAIGSHDDVY